MSSRHTRRKAAKAAMLQKNEDLILAQRAWETAQIVKANKSSPIGENYVLTDRLGKAKVHRITGAYPSCINDVASMKIAAMSVSFREPRASGGMSQRSVQGLKAKGAKFTRADMLVPDNASLDGQALDGRAIREQAERERLAQIQRVKGEK